MDVKINKEQKVKVGHLAGWLTGSTLNKLAEVFVCL